MITLTQLEYIVAIDEYRHFATAAEKCFVTQPTLSMQIKKLEEDLGIIIFDRSRQPIEPTDIGVKIIEQARIALSSTERIKEIIKEDRQVMKGTLKIGIIPTLAPYLLPVFIGYFVRKYPDIEVEVEEVESEEMVRKIKRGLIDVGLFVTPYPDAKIVAKPVFYEEMMIYAHPDHPLLKKPEISMEDLATDEIWMLGEGHCFRNQVINLCEKVGLRHNHLPFEFESNSLETLVKIVDREGGFTLIPELMLLYMSDEKKRQVRAFPRNKPLREVSVIHSCYYVKQRLVALLSEEIKSMIPAHMLKSERGMVVEWKK